MRKILNSMILGLSAVLALAGCGGVTDPIKTWRNDDVTAMNETLGRVLPVAPLSSNYVSDHYVEDNYGTIIYFYDETIDDRSEAYGEILLASGYEYDRTSESSEGYELHFYYFEIEHEGIYDYINVQLNYYPGSETFEACFEIYAWFEDGGEMFAEWPESKLEEVLGTTETVPTFAAEKYLIKYLADYDIYGLYGYSNDATLEATYTSTLDGAGWTIDNSRYNDGYGIYAESPEGELTLQYVYHDDTDDDEDMLIVYIYVNDAEEETPSE